MLGPHDPEEDCELASGECFRLGVELLVLRDVDELVALGKHNPRNRATVRWWPGGGWYLYADVLDPIKRMSPNQARELATYLHEAADAIDARRSAAAEPS